MKHLEISIPSPCHEDWNKMTPFEKGKYCALCEKTVIDFSGMSDAQLVAFFRSNKGNMCGRFAKDQLDRSIEIPRKRIPWLRYFFQVAIPAFLVTAKAVAQGKVKVGVETHVLQSDTARLEVKELYEQKQKGKVITGVVTDTAGTPISNAAVVLKGTRIGTSTGIDGSFRLVNDRYGNFLEVSSIIFETKVVDVSNQKDPVHVSLTESLVG